MKKLTAILATLLIVSSTSLWADDNNNNEELRLNKVILPLQAEQWLTTKTALVNVAVNAAAADKDIEKVRSSVMQKLLQIASNSEWHIISFDRQQDNSGLENIQISAQARLNQTDLNGLRDKAKAISKAGETYTIDSIDFSPSNDEVRAANIALRTNIYQQAKAEIDTLNNLYPAQKYYLHKIDFTITPGPLPMAKTMMFTANVANNAAAVPVGAKATLSATVELASDPTTPPPSH